MSDSTGDVVGMTKNGNHGLRIVMILLMVLMVLLAVVYDQPRVAVYDAMIIEHVQGWESEAFTLLMRWLSELGGGWFAFAIAGAMLIVSGWFCQSLKHSAVYFVIMSGSYVINLLLKSWFERPRPELLRLAEAAGWSFPSGHAMIATAMYGGLVWILWPVMASRARILLLLFAVIMIVLIGLSRIYLGVHYPSDVLGGWLGGYLCVALFSLGIDFPRKYRDRKQSVIKGLDGR